MEREKVNGREAEMVWMEGFGPPKNFGLAPLTSVARALADGRGREREGRREERKGRTGAESRKRGRKKSWNRAADGLRPALRVQPIV